MSPNLAGKICLVTGASRGIGRGIALQLGAAGATVYITGRTFDQLQECANEVKSRGAKDAIPLRVDHANDGEVLKLFETIKNDQSGQLDVLVNNAYSGVGLIFDNHGKKFWETDPIKDWDTVNNVGLRNHYLCTTYASRIMTEQRSGLIINVSSVGGLRYLFGVSYGVGKCAVDRMVADCAMELKKFNVAMISLWPGPVQTEEIQNRILNNGEADQKSKDLFASGESTEFSGKAVAHLAADPKIMKKTGKILMTSDLCREYSFTENDGTIPLDPFSLTGVLQRYGHTWLAAITPAFVRMPKVLLHMAGYKF